MLHCHILGTLAAAFLFLDGSAVYVLRARGSGDIPSPLGFREGMEGPLTPWQRTPPSGNLEVLVPMFFLQTALANVSLIWTVRAAGGRHYVLCGTAEYLTGFVLIVPGPFEREGNARAAKHAR